MNLKSKIIKATFHKRIDDLLPDVWIPFVELNFDGNLVEEDESQQPKAMARVQYLSFPVDFYWEVAELPEADIINKMRHGERPSLALSKLMYRYIGDKLQSLRKDEPLRTYVEELRCELQTYFPERKFLSHQHGEPYNPFLSSDYYIKDGNDPHIIEVKLARDSLKLTVSGDMAVVTPLLESLKTFLMNYVSKFSSVNTL